MTGAPRYVVRYPRGFLEIEKPAGQLDRYFDADAVLHAHVIGLIDKGVDPAHIHVYERTTIRVEVEPRVVRIVKGTASDEAPCTHEAWEEDGEGRKVRCADCGEYLSGVLKGAP